MTFTVYPYDSEKKTLCLIKDEIYDAYRFLDTKEEFLYNVLYSNKFAALKDMSRIWAIEHVKYHNVLYSIDEFLSKYREGEING